MLHNEGIAMVRAAFVCEVCRIAYQLRAEAETCEQEHRNDELAAKNVKSNFHTIVSGGHVTIYQVKCRSCSCEFEVTEDMGCMGPNAPSWDDDHTCTHCGEACKIYPEDDLVEICS